MTLTECPICGARLEINHADRPLCGGHYWCDQCEQFRGYAPLPPEQYGDIEMPFGQFKNSTLAEIASLPGGIGYLGWVSLNARGSQLRAMTLGYLEQLWASPAIAQTSQ